MRGDTSRCNCVKKRKQKTFKITLLTATEKEKKATFQCTIYYILRFTIYFAFKTLQIKSYSGTILMNAIGQYFPVALDLRLRKFPENSENY